MAQKQLLIRCTRQLVEKFEAGKRKARTWDGQSIAEHLRPDAKTICGDGAAVRDAFVWLSKFDDEQFKEFAQTAWGADVERYVKMRETCQNDPARMLFALDVETLRRFENHHWALIERKNKRATEEADARRRRDREYVIVVTGSDRWDWFELMCEKLDEMLVVPLAAGKRVTIAFGKSHYGAEDMADGYSKSRKYHSLVYSADEGTKEAVSRRSRHVLDAADPNCVVAFFLDDDQEVDRAVAMEIVARAQALMFSRSSRLTTVESKTLPRSKWVGMGLNAKRRRIDSSGETSQAADSSEGTVEAIVSPDDCERQANGVRKHID